MKFQINMNGNSAADIRADLFAVDKAARALEDALMGMATNTLHGRNYQTVVDGEEARVADSSTAITYIKQARSIRAAMQAELERLMKVD